MTNGYQHIHRGRLPVEFSQFLLFDHASGALPSNIDTGEWSTALAVAGDGGVIFHAKDRSIEVEVTLRVWDRHPPASSVAADAPEFTFITATGSVQLCSTTSSPSDVAVTLGGPGRYSVSPRRSEIFMEDDDWQVETWEIDLWPVEQYDTGR